MERSKPCVIILTKRIPNASKMITKFFILKHYSKKYLTNR